MNLSRITLHRTFSLLVVLATLTHVAPRPLAGQTAEPQPAQSKQQPANVESVIEMAQQAQRDFALGKYKQAAQSSKKVCQSRPTNPSYWLFHGDICFAAGQFADSVAAYDAAIRLQPKLKPRLWQRGLSLYYADQFDEGVKQFEVHQTVNSQDVENAVWHLLCAAKVADLKEARKKLIPISGDTRIPMSQIYELFAGRMTPNEVLKVAEKTSQNSTPNNPQLKLQLYYAHLYIGLYHEMLGESKLAMQSLERATRDNPLNATNFMGQVARVHLDLRKSQNKMNSPAKQ